MKKIAILQSNYIPWMGYFQLINAVDEFVIYDSVQYTKNDWRNRNQIKTPYGLKWISIPVIKENLTQKAIDEVKVSSADWRKDHLNKLRENYRGAPNFEETFTWFQNILNKTINIIDLSEINILFIREICSVLDIRTKITNCRSLSYSGDKSQKILDICKELSATVYVSGPAAKNYLNEELFNRGNIGIEWMEYNLNYNYKQLHGEFVYNVSIIDVLFNVGLENSKKILEGRII